jgi:hypothetical protein
VGAWMIFFFLLYGIYMICFMENAYDVNAKIENNKEIYREYSECVGGPLTEDSEKYLNEIFSERNRLDGEVDALIERLMAGKITEEDYYAFFRENPHAETEYSTVAEILESQYAYVKEEPLKRYIINYNGWTNYFENQIGSVIQLVMVLLVFIPMFCYEYDSRMYILQKMSAKGYHTIFCSKMTAGGLVVIASAVILTTEKLVLHHLRYGLEDQGYPIQSLPRFRDCPWSITIGQGILVDSAVFIVGSLFTAAFIAVLSFFSHRILNLTIVALSVIWIPYFLVSEEIRYAFPFFLSLLFPKGFVMGVLNGNLQVYDYLSAKEFLVMGCVILSFSGGFILMAYQSQKRRWYQ